jgi:hypothetical protein
MLASEVFGVVRRQLGDEGGSPRWPDAVLVGYLNDAQGDVKRLRPDLLLGESGLITLGTIATVNTACTFGVEQREALACLVTSKALAEDGTDAGNVKLAGEFEGKARGLLGL